MSNRSVCDVATQNKEREKEQKGRTFNPRTLLRRTRVIELCVKGKERVGCMLETSNM